MAGFDPGLHLSGRGGILLQGWDELTTLGPWVATPSKLSHGGPGLRISVGKHTPDPFLFEHYDPDRPLVIEMTIGKQQITRPARILSKEPLVIEAWQEEG